MNTTKSKSHASVESAHHRPASGGALLSSLVIVVLCALSFLWSARPGRASHPGVTRLPQAFAAAPESSVKNAVKGHDWTQYSDYRTLRLGRVERPARLITGRQRVTRSVVVPRGGAQYETFIGAVDGPATVTLGRPGAADVETRADPGRWTRLAFALDSRDGPKQSIDISVDVAPGSLAAWGSELVTVPRAPDGPADVILISLDTVRRDQLTPYAPTLATTPVLADLARESLVFTQAIATSSWTIASHATLFTGHFPADSLGYDSRVEPEEYTLPEIFAANGYRTFGVSGGPYTDPRWGLHQGFDEYVASADRENASDATSRAIEWLKADGGAPAFVFLNYFNAHEPLTLSPEVRQRSGVTEDVPHAMWTELAAGRQPLTTAVRRQLLRAYRGEVTAIDTELGRLFDYLKNSGRWSQTLVIVWSDHGQLLGEGGNLGHALTLEEELIRVPLMIKPAAGSELDPGVSPAPMQGDSLFGLIQKLGGLPDLEDATSVPVLKGHATTTGLTFSKIHHDPLPALTSQRRWRSATLWAVRDGTTKIVRDLEGRAVAYDVTGLEERPIEMPGPDSLLLRVLHNFRLATDRVTSRPTVGPLSPEHLERLRALGYVR